MLLAFSFHPLFFASTSSFCCFLDWFWSWDELVWLLYVHSAWGCKFPNGDLVEEIMIKVNNNPIICTWLQLLVRVYNIKKKSTVKILNKNQEIQKCISSSRTKMFQIYVQKERLERISLKWYYWLSLRVKSIKWNFKLLIVWVFHFFSTMEK